MLNLCILLTAINISVLLYAIKYAPPPTSTAAQRTISALRHDLMRFSAGNYTIVALMCGSTHICRWRAFHAYTEMARLSYIDGATLCIRTLDKDPLLMVLNELCNMTNVCHDYTVLIPLGVPIIHC